MLLSTQLKRGYIALIGMSLIAASLVTTPDPGFDNSELVQKAFVITACRTNHQTHWKLASTPFDMPALPSYQIRLCQS